MRTSPHHARRMEERNYAAGLGEFTLAELIRFAELAGMLRTTTPKAFHEMWRCVKDKVSVKMFAPELVRLGMPNGHPLLNDPEALRVAKEAMPFFYTERCVDMRRILVFRPSAIDELCVGKEYERGVIHLAFLQYSDA